MQTSTAMPIQEENFKAPENGSKPKSFEKPESDYNTWITTLAELQQRVYYRDQNPQTLKALARLMKAHRPDKVVELGTGSGLSLRTWLEQDPQVKVVCVDISFKALRQSFKELPLNLANIKLIEQNILDLKFEEIYNDEKVFLYIDAHDLPDVPIMEYLLKQALPKLKPGSLVVVDDLWFCDQEPSQATLHSFFENRILKDIDPLFLFQAQMAPYWEAGFFAGFPEVTPLLQWINTRKIPLIFQEDLKFAAFFWPQPHQEDESFSLSEFQNKCSGFDYNPTDLFQKVNTLEYNREAIQLARTGVDLFSSENLFEALKHFSKAQEKAPNLPGIYLALAICLLRMGHPLDAEQLLVQELEISPNSHKARTILEDLKNSNLYQKAHNPKNKPCDSQTLGTGRLFSDHTVKIDPRCLSMGGSWTKREGRIEAYEAKLLEFFFNQAKGIENPLILDIGSNTGSFSLLPSIDPQMSVHAFEPSAQAYEVLKANIKLNNLENKVTAHNLALAHQKGHCSLKLPQNQEESGLACLGDPLRFKEFTEVSVEVMTLDQAADSLAIPKADLIKIDTEGCELFVLMGGENFIKANRPGILVEYYAQNTAQFGYEPQKIVDLLCSYGYTKAIQVSETDLFFPSEK